LGKDHPAFSVHGIGHRAPALDLCLAVDAWRPGVTLATGFDLGALADDQAGTGALLVIPGHEGRWDVTGLSAALARERRHDDTILQRDGAQRCGLEQRAMLHD